MTRVDTTAAGRRLEILRQVDEPVAPEDLNRLVMLDEGDLVRELVRAWRDLAEAEAEDAEWYEREWERLEDELEKANAEIARLEAEVRDVA